MQIGEGGYTSTTQRLFQTFAAKRKEMSLLYAAPNGDTSLCKQLIAYGKLCGYDVGEREPDTLSTPLHLAALFGHEKIIQLLLSHNSHNKADVNSRNRIEATPLHCASTEGHIVSVVTLLQAGADPLLTDNYGQLPIHAAARNNKFEVVRILIEQGGCSPDQVRHSALQSLQSLSTLSSPSLSPCSQTQRMEGLH